MSRHDAVMQGNGVSYDHLMRQIDARLENIERAIDRLADHQEERHEKLNGRIRVLEDSKSQVKGGWTVLGIIGGVAGAVGGMASKWFGG